MIKVATVHRKQRKNQLHSDLSPFVLGVDEPESGDNANPSRTPLALPNRLARAVEPDPVPRAKGRCEHCRRPHGRDVFHCGDGTWWNEDAATWRDGRGRGLRCLPAPAELPVEQPGLAGIDAPTILRFTRVVLSSAHLNHDPGDNRPRNLAALCQRCHMLHDAAEHRRRRWFNAFRLRAIGDLFA